MAIRTATHASRPAPVLTARVPQPCTSASALVCRSRWLLHRGTAEQPPTGLDSQSTGRRVPLPRPEPTPFGWGSARGRCPFREGDTGAGVRRGQQSQGEPEGLPRMTPAVLPPLPGLRLIPRLGIRCPSDGHGRHFATGKSGAGGAGQGLALIFNPTGGTLPPGPPPPPPASAPARPWGRGVWVGDALWRPPTLRMLPSHPTSNAHHLRSHPQSLPLAPCPRPQPPPSPCRGFCRNLSPNPVSRPKPQRLWPSEQGPTLEKGSRPYLSRSGAATSAPA